MSSPREKKKHEVAPERSENGDFAVAMRAKVSDFGLACLGGGGRGGTVRFKAPELYSRRGRATTKADVRPVLHTGQGQCRALLVSWLPIAPVHGGRIWPS